MSHRSVLHEIQPTGFRDAQTTVAAALVRAQSDPRLFFFFSGVLSSIRVLKRQTFKGTLPECGVSDENALIGLHRIPKSLNGRVELLVGPCQEIHLSLKTQKKI